MDAERRRRALQALKSLNAAKHSDTIKGLIDEQSDIYSAQVDNDILDESREELSEQAADKLGLTDILAEEELKKEEMEEEDVPEVNDMGAEFMELLKQLKK